MITRARFHGTALAWVNIIYIIFLDLHVQLISNVTRVFFSPRNINPCYFFCIFALIGHAIYSHHFLYGFRCEYVSVLPLLVSVKMLCTDFHFYEKREENRK